MSELDPVESMIVQAYGMYLDKGEGLSFSTRSSYRKQLVNYFYGEQEETPPHYEDALEKLADYTSKTSEGEQDD